MVQNSLGYCTVKDTRYFKNTRQSQTPHNREEELYILKQRIRPLTGKIMQSLFLSIFYH